MMELNYKSLKYFVLLSNNDAINFIIFPVINHKIHPADISYFAPKQ